MMQWSYDTLLKWGTDELAAHSVDNASVDAWYLLEHIYGISRVDFLIRRNDPFDEAQMKQSEKEAKTLENILVTKDLQWDYMDIKEMIEKRQNGQG